MWFSTIHVLILVFVIQSIYALPSGAPNGACNHMKPAHDPFEPESPDNSAAIVKLITNPAEGSAIQPGQTVSVSLEAQGDQGFMGFIVQATDENDNQVGTWSFEGDAIGKMYCNEVEGSSITHTGPEEKRDIKATWQAPDDPNLGFVVFKCSVVMDYTNYYAKLSLKPMKISR